MSNRSHHYEVRLEWTGAGAGGTRSYDAYSREFSVRIEGKPELLGSSDPVYRGDRSKVNPEELLVASLSACHMLWYLHLCANHGIVVVRYSDRASGVLELDRDRGGHFSEVVLRPFVGIANGELRLAERLHEDARAKCFIANSVNFPVRHEPRVEPADPSPAAPAE